MQFNEANPVGGVKMSDMKKVFVVLLVVLSFASKAQDEPVDFVQDQAQNQEIYVHFDKSFYVAGETIWFSLYNFKADNYELIFGRRFMEITLIDRNKQILKRERIRVVDGKSWGQIAIPDYLATGQYMFLVTYPFENANNFLYRKLLSIFSPTDEGTSADIEIENTTITDPLIDFKEIKELPSVLTLSANKVSYSPREPITITLDLENSLTGKASVVVRQKGMYGINSSDIRSVIIDPSTDLAKSRLKETELTNYRENKKLSWELVDSHGLLLYELVQVDSASESSIPYAYIPEDRTTHAVFEVKPGQYVFDATDLSGDQKSMYFTSFEFGVQGAESKGAIDFKAFTNKVPNSPAE